MSLVVASCSYEAAKWAVEHWHYSKRMPCGKLVPFGAWEDDRYVGAVIFGSGANQLLLRPYDLDQMEGCELVRVALRSHESPTTQILSSAIRLLKNTNPGLRLLVSYADMAQNHHGGIYQAGNWIYLGEYVGTHGVYRINGKVVHGRSIYARYGTRRLDWLRANVDSEATPVLEQPKHRYVYPLDRRIRKQIAPLALPYPHADEDSKESRPTSGGESRVRSPASALQS